MVFQQLPTTLAALACLGRIQDFIEQDPRSDYRGSSSDDIPGTPETGGQRKGSGEKPSSDAMRISGGNFGWEENKPCLKQLDLNIPAGQLTIVVGPVASGKSTLCKAILGEAPTADGRITIQSPSRRLGYCDQIPYLSNGTIRQNIIGFARFDQSRYDEVIEATALGTDFDVLPQGDDTNVGSNGITLSGGQKQRVSMARALYLDSDFVVFDDILSGLDADTEAIVFRRVFGPDGVLRKRGATAVLCTHSVRHLPSADHVVALGTDGAIVEQGTFVDLLANKNYIHSLGVKTDTGAQSSEKGPATEIAAARPPLVQTLTTQSLASTAAEARGKLMADTSVYRYYVSSITWPPIAVFLGCGVAYGFLVSFQTIWLKFWAEDISSPAPMRSNGFYIGLYALFQTSTLATLFFECLVCLTTMIRISGTRLHNATLKAVVCAPLAFFTTTDTGTVINLFSQDLTIIDGDLPMGLVNLGLDVWTIIGQAAVIATSSPYLAVSYPFLFGILYVLQKFYLRTSKQLRLLELEAKSPLYTNFLDTIKGVVTYRAFGWMPDGIALNTRLLNQSQRPEYLLVMIQHWLGFVLQLIVAALAVVVITLSTQLRSNSGFTGASLVALMSFGESLTYIIRWYTMVETSIGAVSRLKTFKETTKSESSDDEDVVPPEEWPLKGGLEIRGVSASYGENKNGTARDSMSSSNSDARNLAIKDLTVSIQPGEKVAICGRSGSGKSSTILLLLRLLDPLQECSENITIDSIPLHKIDRSTLRQRIIAVPQDPVFLPDGTPFRANLDIFEAATDEECRQVLEAVDLWRFVTERGGLDAGMSEDSLSQGQKQLFSLARAMVRRRVRKRQHEAEYGSTDGEEKAEKRTVAPAGGILLLDEVSSSVDQDTDQAMQAIIKAEFAGYTIVMVSHRLDMVMDFDTVIVMDKGAMVEKGAPQALAKKEGSRFRELWLIGSKG